MNRNIVFILLSVFSLLLSVSSCVKGDEIGDMYGRWKLNNFSSKEKSVDINNVFVSFTGDVYVYQANKGYDWGMCSRNENELFLDKTKYESTFSDMYMPLRKDARFTIVSIDSKSMVLQRNDSIWTFEKLLGK